MTSIISKECRGHGDYIEFVREQKRYAKNDLSEIFRLSSGETETFIKNLKAFGVLKSVKASTSQRELSDLVDEDIEIADVISGNDDYFMFSLMLVLLQ